MFRYAEYRRLMEERGHAPMSEAQWNKMAEEVTPEPPIRKPKKKEDDLLKYEGEE